jgi:hypothetical protein
MEAFAELVGEAQDMMMKGSKDTSPVPKEEGRTTATVCLAAAWVVQGYAASLGWMGCRHPWPDENLRAESITYVT